MRAANTQVLNEALPLEQQIQILQRQVDKLYRALQGRISLGTGVDGVSGQNVEGEWRTYVSNGAPNTEDTLAHTVGSIPLGYIVVNQDKAGSIYQGPTTGTAWTSSNIYVKCSIASVTFLLFLVKKGAVTSG